VLIKKQYVSAAALASKHLEAKLDRLKIKYGRVVGSLTLKAAD
jgi:hypothetical protein